MKHDLAHRAHKSQKSSSASADLNGLQLALLKDQPATVTPPLCDKPQQAAVLRLSIPLPNEWKESCWLESLLVSLTACSYLDAILHCCIKDRWHTPLSQQLHEQHYSNVLLFDKGCCDIGAKNTRGSRCLHTHCLFESDNTERGVRMCVAVVRTCKTFTH